MATPDVVSGRLLTAAGAAFPKGAPVELVAYPSAEVVDSMVVGDDIQVTPVAKGFVKADGNFALRLPPGTDLARFESAAGSVDLEVRDFSGDYYAAHSLSSTPADLEALAPGSTASSGVRVGVEVRSLPANPAVRALAESRTAALDKTDVCGETLVANYGSKAVTVGATYTGGSGRTGEFTYTSGASSQLGVGFSTSGVYGSFSSSGTISRSSTDQVEYSAGTGGRAYKTYFKYGKYSQWCYPIYNPSQKSVYAYKVHASGFAGGGYVASASVPSASHCVPLGNGLSYSKTNTASTTFSSGASLSSTIGINLSSKTGYTSSAWVKYKNTSGSSRNLCGVYDVPGGSPGWIVLK